VATNGRDIAGEKAAQRKFEQFLELAADAIVGSAPTAASCSQTPRPRSCSDTRDEVLGAPVELLVPERFRDVHPEHRDGYLSDPVTRPMGAGLELFGRRKVR
jgi:hypothetical protein